MSTDPKKNDEIKDEGLDKVSGGAVPRPPDEEPEGDVRPTKPTTTQSPEKI